MDESVIFESGGSFGAGVGGGSAAGAGGSSSRTVKEILKKIPEFNSKLKALDPRVELEFIVGMLLE